MRPATAVIDLAALRHNLAEARRRASGSRMVAVVKADAYGHAAARVVPALAAADMLGVACIEEALALREAGAAQPILLLEGVGPGTKLSYASDWSEYFGHQPQDGTGDVFFYLGPLSTSPPQQ